MSKSRIFYGGVPTAMDVAKLMAAVDPWAGTAVSYADVERIIGHGVATNRFRTVTMAWRKHVFRARLLQSEAAGGQFRFLTADQAQDACLGRFKRFGRAAGRLRVRVEAIAAADLSTEDRRKQSDLMRREAQAVLQAAQQAAVGIGLLPAATQGASVRLAPPAAG